MDVNVDIDTAASDTARTLVDAWLARTAVEGTFSPSAVQDLMFDLWGAYRETPAQAVIETWLTLTLERSMFSADEVRTTLQSVRDLTEPAAAL